MSSRPTEFPGDAIAVLKTEHRELLDRFQRFLRLPPHEREQGWRTLQEAIRVHMDIEAELLYPAFLDATEDSLVHFVALVGHENITAQIREVSEVPSSGGYFASRVRSLKRIFAHHVWDMERDGGMYDEASRSTINHELLARLVRARYAAGPVEGPILSGKKPTPG
jgi:hemerythrin HHE cation binding domain-containing protein